MGMTRLICVGTRFLSLCVNAGDAGDHVPTEDRGEEEEAGEYMLKLLSEDSRVGDVLEMYRPFSSSMLAVIRCCGLIGSGRREELR